VPEAINRATALWTRTRNDISEEEYEEFYKHVSHDFEGPLETIHSRVEGNLEYTSLLFIPKRAPYDLWDRNARRGIKLYVKRVFIMDDAEQLMPSYLRFVRGVIDTADLPLNVSREILQANRQVDSMRSGSVKKVLGALERMAKNDAEKYAGFWSEFGKVLKEGVVEDTANREDIAKLLRFVSTQSAGDEQQVSLENYIARMKEGQSSIYYITADALATARNSPHLEIFAKKDVEVLLLVDDVDEWVVTHLTEFDGKTLRSVSKGDLELGDVPDTKGAEDSDDLSDDKTEEEFKTLVESITTTLGDRIKEVRISQRLTTSPACLVADEHEMGAHLERILKAAGQDIGGSKPILEINPTHPIVRRMNAHTDDALFADWAHVLHDQALLSEGGQLEDPATFVRRLNELFESLAAGSEAA
jgi:molecular chaperone HtpG